MCCFALIIQNRERKALDAGERRCVQGRFTIPGQEGAAGFPLAPALWAGL